MEFLEDTSREKPNCMNRAAGTSCHKFFGDSTDALYPRLVFHGKGSHQEHVAEDNESWENPDIDSLLDNRELRLLTKQEVMDELNAIRKYLEGRLAVIRSSRGNVSDFIMQMADGGDIQQKLDFVMGNLEELQAKMYEEETGQAYEQYKDQFDEALAAILGTKAEMQKVALEKFIEETPPYLDRVLKKARKLGEKDVVSIVQEAKAIKEGKSEEEIKNTLDWLAGDEHEMSPTEYMSWSDELESNAEEELESWLEGDIDDQELNTNYGDLLDDARERGGEKIVVKLRILRHRYRIRRESYELSELAYIREIFGEDGQEGKLHQEIRNVQGKVRYEHLTEQEAAIELWPRLTMLIEHASSKLNFHIEDGELKNVQDFMGRLARQYDGPPDFDAIVAECDQFRDGLSSRESRHYSNKERHEKLLEESQEKLVEVNHDALVYHYAYKDITEKETAQQVLEQMNGEMGEAMAIMREDWESGDLGAMQATAYTLGRLDDFFDTVASVELSGTSRTSGSKKSPQRRRGIDSLLGAFNAFEGHETESDQVVEDLREKGYEVIANRIEERISQVGGEVRFVDRESFDRFFDGKKQDNFKGLPGAFHNGMIFLVYPLDTLDVANVERLYKVLTHEAIHHTMHDEVEGETSRFLNVLLYGAPTYSPDGLERAMSAQTIGGHIIRQFMIDKGDEFEDWVQRRTKIGPAKKPNGKLTFEEIIHHEDVAKEILEEAITVYLTYYALNGRQAQMFPPYLDYLRQFHETDEGQTVFEKFLPTTDAESHSDVSLGADGADASGISAAAGGGEEVGDTETPDLDQLSAKVETVSGGTIAMIKNLLNEIYSVDDYEGVLASASSQLGDTKKRIEALKEREKEGEEISASEREAIKTEIETLDKHLKENMLSSLQAEQALRGENPENEWSFAERMWRKTTFVAVDDVLKIFQDAWAYLKERRELRRDRVSSEIGESVAPTERMSSYFSGLNQSVQNRDVSKWKEIYTDKDPQTLNEILNNAEDVNQVKALFEMKAETYGDFFFRNPQTLAALTRISGRKVKTYQQAKSVFDEIYGQGEAEGLERKNTSSRKGKVNESSEAGAAHADTLKEEWMQMIGDMQAGDWVDSAKFEGFIQYAITAGKSYQRQLLWVIAKGFALDILDHTTLVEMGGSSLIGHDPHIEYMGKLAKDNEAGIIYKGGMTEIMYIASLNLFTPGGQQTNMVDDPDENNLDQWIEYEHWLLRKADKEETVQQRFGKIKSSLDKVDHDYVQDIWWEFNDSAYRSIFSERTGAVQFVQDEGIVNIYAQFITNSLHWDDKDLEKWLKQFLR